MVKFKRSTADTVAEHVHAFWKMLVCEHDEEARAAWADDVNRFFDELLEMDAFGTEGQCDPRGDHRD